MPPAPAPVFFTHVMKTGGMSLNFLLRRSFDPARCYPETSDGAAWGRNTSVPALLALGRRAWDEIDYFSPHMPAWVAGLVAPDHVTVTVIREPVARTISHLQQIAAKTQGLPDDLEELFEVPSIGDRLADYQTGLFAASMSDQAADDLAAQRGTVDPQDPWTRQEMLAALTTAVARPRTLGPDDLARARDRLSAIDVVGVTDDLTGCAATLGTRTGLALGQPGRVNVTTDPRPVTDSLRDRIRERTRLDAELYAVARSLAS